MGQISGRRRRRRMVVRIVYPGGHVELHDAPILAGEIMARHPKCSVAHPDVFRQPLAAVVSPETTLMLGQKFYVVPTRTIRKLQRKFAKRNPNLGAAASFPATAVIECNKNNGYVVGNAKSGRRRVGCFGCFSNLMNGNIIQKHKSSTNDRCSYSTDDYRMGIVNWSGSSGSGSASFGSPDGQILAWNNYNSKGNYHCSGNKNKNKSKKNVRSAGAGTHQSPKKGFGLDNWTPNLESITEE